VRVLCSSPPMEGVFAPFVPLGRALLADGHDVLVATGPDLEARVASEGFTTAVAGSTAMEAAITAMAEPTASGGPTGQGAGFGGVMFGSVIAAATLPALHRLADDFAPDLIVHPPVDVAAPLVAAVHDMPSVCYGFGQVPAPDLVAALAHHVAPRWQQTGLEADPQAGIFRGLYLDPCPPSLRDERSARPAMARPMRPEIPGDPNAELPPWIDTLGRRPIVHVSLGTVPFFNQPARFLALLAELAKTDVDLVVTVGKLNDPAALGLQPTNVHVERWLSLAALLPHCDAVLCHAGSGTTLAALATGLPLVLVPQGADQFTNAAACERAGVARVLEPDAVTSTAVRDALCAVLDPASPQRHAAARVAAEIAAMPAPHDVATDLANLVTSGRSPTDHTA
jgi:UDP:flavonoid glycosyltransferase YjiC (YdhE family)